MIPLVVIFSLIITRVLSHPHEFSDYGTYELVFAKSVDVSCEDFTEGLIRTSPVSREQLMHVLFLDSDSATIILRREIARSLAVAVKKLQVEVGNSGTMVYRLAAATFYDRLKKRYDGTRVKECEPPDYAQEVAQHDHEGLPDSTDVAGAKEHASKHHGVQLLAATVVRNRLRESQDFNDIVQDLRDEDPERVEQVSPKMLDEIIKPEAVDIMSNVVMHGCTSERAENADPNAVDCDSEISNMLRRADDEIPPSQIDSPPHDDGGIGQWLAPAPCFPSDAFVISTAGPLLMRDLVVGEQILVPSKDALNYNGLMFEPLCLFLHRDSEVCSTFLEFVTAFGVLSISPNHYLPLTTVSGRRWTQAKGVKRGDMLNYIDSTVPVISVTSTYSCGVYAPVTPSGTMFVNGFEVSCYASVHPHLAHHAVKFVTFWSYLLNMTQYTESTFWDSRLLSSIDITF